jgi:hypothetical protein
MSAFDEREAKQRFGEAFLASSRSLSRSEDRGGTTAQRDLVKRSTDTESHASGEITHVSDTGPHGSRVLIRKQPAHSNGNTLMFAGESSHAAASRVCRFG